MSSYSEQTARLWMAMNIGPLWIGRDEDDPLSPAAIAQDESKPAPITQTSPAEVKPAVAQAHPAVNRSPHEHAPLTSPESHREKTYELKPIRRVFADPGIVEVDSELLTQAQNADWKTLEKIVSVHGLQGVEPKPTFNRFRHGRAQRQDGDCRRGTRAR